MSRESSVHPKPRLMAPWGPFRHRVDIAPFLVIMTLAAVQLGLFFGTESTLIRLAGMAAVWPFTTIAIAIAHGHFHAPTFRWALLNRLYEFIFFYQCGMPSYGWQLNHNFGHHHNYLTQDASAPLRDEYYWLEPDGTITPRWRYVIRTVVFSFWYVIPTSRRRPDYLRKLGVVAILHGMVIGALFAYDALGALICFVAIFVPNMFVNAYFSYSHHAGLSTSDRYGASYTNLNRLENLLTFNTGYHTAHHVRPGVHWYVLPEFHASIAERIPAHCYLSEGLTWEIATAQYARTQEEQALRAPAKAGGAARA